MLSCEAVDTEPRIVEYKVTGKSFDKARIRSGFGVYASVTMSNSGGDTEQISSVALPYTKKIAVKKGAFLYISAQAREKMQITTEIYVNGRRIKSSTSSGDYVIATASGSCP